jgi:hypothetical protein
MIYPSDTDIREQEMEAEARDDHQATCIACLQDDMLDGFKLCKICRPSDPGTLQALVTLLKEPYELKINEVEASRNQGNGKN